MISFTILYNFSWVIMKGKPTLLSQLYTATFLWILIDLKWQTSSLRMHQVFLILMIKILFPQIQQVPGPNFR